MEWESQLIKAIVNDINFSGNIQLGHQVMLGYFAQDEAHMLDLNQTVFEQLIMLQLRSKKENQTNSAFLFLEMI